MSWSSAANSSSSRSAACESVQLRRPVEELERERRDLAGVRLGPVAAAGEADDRLAADRVRVVGPVVGLVAPDRVEHDALAQRPLRDGQRVEVELLHRGGEQHRAGDDEVDAAGVEPLHAQPVGAPSTRGSPCGAEQLAPGDRQLVERGRVLVAPGGDHLRQALERPAAPDRELRLEGGDLLTTGASSSTIRSRRARRSRLEIGSECTSSAVRRATPSGRLVAHVRLPESPTITSRLPPPRSKHARRRGVEHDRRADRAEDQARLLLTADDLDGNAGLVADAVDQLGAVLGAADRARRARVDLGGAGGVGQQAEAAHGGDRLVGGGRRDRAVPADDVAEPQHLLLLHERVEVPVGVDVGHEEVEGVRPEVHGGDAHVPQGKRRARRPKLDEPYGGGVTDAPLADPARFRAMGTDVDVLPSGGRRGDDARRARGRRAGATRSAVEPVPAHERAVPAQRRRGCAGRRLAGRRSP